MKYHDKDRLRHDNLTSLQASLQVGPVTASQTEAQNRHTPPGIFSFRTCSVAPAQTWTQHSDWSAHDEADSKGVLLELPAGESVPAPPSCLSCMRLFLLCQRNKVLALSQPSAMALHRQGDMLSFSGQCLKVHCCSA
jgi:hypothetical protein